MKSQSVGGFRARWVLEWDLMHSFADIFHHHIPAVLHLGISMLAFYLFL
jgi:hypothetical protein